MKIAKRQLRKIIQEEMAHPRGDLGKNIADADFPIVVGYHLNAQPQSEIAYNRDELDEILDFLAPMGPGGRDIPYSLESLDLMEPADIPAGAGIERFSEGKMRITKRQLRRIIREAVIKESRGPADPEYVASALRTTAAAGPNKGVPFGEIAMDAVVASEWQAAANAVMSALWVDDPWPEDEEALEDMLAEVDPGDIPDLALVGAKWLTKFRAGGWHDHTKPMDWDAGVSSLYTRPRK